MVHCKISLGKKKVLLGEKLTITLKTLQELSNNEKKLFKDETW
jgi:hypothetical protein